MEKKIRILGIAPYIGMKEIMETVAGERNDIEIDIRVADLYAGVEAVKSLGEANYDVIISRGETADLVAKETTLPVISISLSFYDLLRALTLADNYSGKYAIVGFAPITDSVKALCSILQKDVDIITVSTAREVPDILRHLRTNGYQMVLGDVFTHSEAKKIGLNAILITSGPESISEAYDRAHKQVDLYNGFQTENAFLNEVIKGASGRAIVLDAEGNVVFKTIDDNLLGLLQSSLIHELPNVLKREEYKFFKNIEETLYSFTCKSFTVGTVSYAAFYLYSNTLPFVTSKYGIRYTNLQETIDAFFNSFYSVTSSLGNLEEYIDNINHSNLPVMIVGEAGCGKEQVARAIYSKSRFSNNPMILVNCALLNDKSWNFLTNHYNSPFNDNNNTIHLENITALTEDRLRHLLSIIIDTKLATRNRLIFSCVCEGSTGLPKPALEFVNMLSCVMVHLSPLRERTEAIPTLSSIYLSTLNAQGSNQIVGFESDAMALMEKYSWPYNYTQFKRILNELFMLTSTPFIRAKDVSTVLAKEDVVVKKEAPEPVSRPGTLIVDINQSLDEINQKIIQAVLDANDGNQSAAAKQLGISRTTLWRILKYE